MMRTCDLESGSIRRWSLRLAGAVVLLLSGLILLRATEVGTAGVSSEAVMLVGYGLGALVALPALLSRRPLWRAVGIGAFLSWDAAAASVLHLRDRMVSVDLVTDPGYWGVAAAALVATWWWRRDEGSTTG